MDYSLLKKTAVLLFLLSPITSYASNPGDYDTTKTGDYDTNKTGDYDYQSPQESSNSQDHLDVQKLQHYSPPPNDSVSNNLDDMKNMDPDVLATMLASQGINNVNVQDLKTQAAQLKSGQGTMTQKPSVDAYGVYRPGIVKNSNGTQTIIMPPGYNSNAANFGANIPAPPRSASNGSVTGTPPSTTPFVGKMYSNMGQEGDNSSDDNGDSDGN